MRASGLLPFLLLPALLGAGRADDGRFHSGAYSFSDELGGFTILSVSGRGTTEEPLHIAQELHSASPVTLVIRAERPIRPLEHGGDFANGFLRLELTTVNGSGFAWIEFEFELQEQRGFASVFGDGLSFDQRQARSETIGSSSFRYYSRDFEPYDRLLFSDGSVDPGATGIFSFLITDFTPRRTFYLVQDPRIPFS